MEIKRNEIQVSPKHLKILREEFNVSRQSVYNALKDITQTILAKDIRSRAIELLKIEIELINNNTEIYFCIDCGHTSSGIKKPFPQKNICKICGSQDVEFKN